MSFAQTILLFMLWSTVFTSPPVPNDYKTLMDEEDKTLLTKKQKSLNKIREKAIATKTYFDPEVETDIIRLEAQVNKLRSQLWRKAFDDVVKKSGGRQSIGIDDTKQLLLHELNNNDELSLPDRRIMYEEVRRLTRLQWARRVLSPAQTQKSHAKSELSPSGTPGTAVK